MEEEGKNWRDLKIGDEVICTNLPTDNDWWDERISIGEKYIIEDKDVMIPNKICIKFRSEWYSHSEFVPYKFFQPNKKFERKIKIEKLLNNSKNVR